MKYIYERKRDNFSLTFATDIFLVAAPETLDFSNPFCETLPLRQANTLYRNKAEQTIEMRYIVKLFKRERERERVLQNLRFVKREKYRCLISPPGKDR